eukprot:scaffold49174_cov49-Phaeocystis_antarctica.AAC.1
MYRAPPGACARPVEVLDQSFIRSNDSLGRPPLYSPSLACRVVPYKTPLFFESLATVAVTNLKLATMA